MRPEKIVFPGDIPVNAFVGNVSRLPYHWHSGLEIILVLEGRVSAGLGNETHLLKKNDMAVINVNEIHRIDQGIGDNKLLILQVDSAFYERTSPDYPCTFIYCCSRYNEPQRPGKYNELKGHIARLVFRLVEKPYKDYKKDVKESLEKLLSHLIYNFDYLRWGPGTNAFDEKQVKRFRRMCERVLAHPAGSPGLKELAEEAGISLYHLSHDIKRRFGYSFQELLDYARGKHAARLLLGTDMRIANISAECGFSDPKYLVKHFKLKYRYTPSEFRKMHRAGDEVLASQVRYQEYPLSSALEYLEPYISS